MIESLSFLREFTMGSVIVRLLLALAGGGLIGYGRSRRERSSGDCGILRCMWNSTT